MRVAARRLRAALRLLRLREFDRAVKKLQDALGDVRDLQLQIRSVISSFRWHSL
jgi:CHAD domain-containing protein